jgi:DNA-binding GntR family transcriptional regulator
MPMADQDAALVLDVATAENLRGRSRAEFVYEQLLDAISEGRLRGTRIREEDIAKTLGVSRTPVREALQRLQERGLLTVGAGRSLVVVELGEREVLELYAMREILEGSAARFAAQHAGAEEIALLYRLHDTYIGAFSEPDRLVPLNRRFHRAIHEAAHNRYLTQALTGVHDSLALLHNTTFRVPARPDRSDLEHRRIIAAIERRDPDAAEAAAREHIRMAMRTRFEMLEG